jgi:hypothetical protein
MLQADRRTYASHPGKQRKPRHRIQPTILPDTSAAEKCRSLAGEERRAARKTFQEKAELQKPSRAFQFIGMILNYNESTHIGFSFSYLFSFTGN